MKSKNTFYEHPDGYMVGVTSKGEEFYFDKENLELVSQYTWCIHHKGYVMTKDYKNQFKDLRLHRLIFNLNNPKLHVDHINHNKIDNRKSNLRICSNAENMRNKRLISTNKSGYKGVCWNKIKKKWISQIKVNQTQMYLGTFADKKEAAQAYNEAALKYFGEFAYLNEV